MRTLHKGCEAILEDWLIKSPPKHKLDFQKSWRNRYFALVRIDQNGGPIKAACQKGKAKVDTSNVFYLMYWNDQIEKNRGKYPIRIIPLNCNTRICVTSHPNLYEKYPHVLMLETHERVFYLCAKELSQKRLWFETILQIIELHGGIKHKSNSDEETTTVDPIYTTLFPIDNDECRQLITDNECHSSTTSTYLHCSQRRSSCLSLYSSHRSKELQSGLSTLSTSLTSIDSKQTFSRRSLLTNKLTAKTHLRSFEKVYVNMEPNLTLPRKGRSAPNLATEKRTMQSCFASVSSADSTHQLLDFQVSDGTFSSDDYDVPFARNTTKKRIEFYDVMIEIPNLSTIQIQEDCLIVKTNTHQWKLTRSKHEDKIDHVL